MTLSDEEFQAADLVVICARHRDVDYARVVHLSPRVFDTRNATADVAPNSKVEKL